MVTIYNQPTPTMDRTVLAARLGRDTKDLGSRRLTSGLARGRGSSGSWGFVETRRLARGFRISAVTFSPAAAGWRRQLAAAYAGFRDGEVVVVLSLALSIAAVVAITTQSFVVGAIFGAVIVGAGAAGYLLVGPVFAEARGVSAMVDSVAETPDDILGVIDRLDSALQSADERTALREVYDSFEAERQRAENPEFESPDEHPRPAKFATRAQEALDAVGWADPEELPSAVTQLGRVVRDLAAELDRRDEQAPRS